MSHPIINRASYATCRTVEEITGPCRARPLAYLRFAIMEQMRANGLSLGQIGRLLHRDHTTILYGLRQAEKLRGHTGFEIIRSAIA